MNRLQKRYSVLLPDEQGMDIFDVCINLRMCLNGSMDGPQVEDWHRYAKFLQTVLDTWEDDGGDSDEFLFDEGVKTLVIRTLKLYKNHLDKSEIL